MLGQVALQKRMGTTSFELAHQSEHLIRQLEPKLGQLEPNLAQLGPTRGDFPWILETMLAPEIHQK